MKAEEGRSAADDSRHKTPPIQVDVALLPRRGISWQHAVQLCRPFSISRPGRDLPGHPGSSPCAGSRTLIGFRPKISAAIDPKAEGLPLHECLIDSLFPIHPGMRQYRRVFQFLENWARSLPLQQWWKDFLQDSGGTGFGHE